MSMWVEELVIVDGGDLIDWRHPSVISEYI
jgi:hypothetical protein